MLDRRAWVRNFGTCMGMPRPFAAGSIWRGTGLGAGSISISPIRCRRWSESCESSLYRDLAGVAREWMGALSLEADFPVELTEFLEQCHARGQARPTPLMLRYRAGDFNCLHQDLYGDVVFPFQVVVGLEPAEEELRAGSCCWWSSDLGRNRWGMRFGWSRGRRW